MNLEGKNILVTGGAGFAGSALVRELLKERANVIIYDNFASGDLSNLSDIMNEIKIVWGDIIDPAFKDVLLRNQVEFVFHLAAEPYIPKCYEFPRKFFEVNATGTLNVLLACKDANVQRILYYSSSEVYGTATKIPMDETHPTLPLSTYSASKLAADRLCFTLFHEQKIPVIILRQFNMYGPRETQPYIIPELITQLMQSDKLKLGNIKARRDFTYVEDAAKGAISLIKEKKAEGEVFNMGTGKDWSVEELANIIGKLLGKESVKIDIDPNRLRPLDVAVLNCDSSKIRKFIGWMPTTKLEDGLQKTIDWYVSNGKRWVWEIKIASENEIWKLKNQKNSN
jgi:nucleoside-diphosphate-sugar epimerase